MLLAIDAGNTNVTLGVFRGTELVSQWRLLTDRDKNGDEYGAEVRGLFEQNGLDLREIEGIAICSVVPPLDEALRCMAESYFELTPLFVDHTTDTGLKILYDSRGKIVFAIERPARANLVSVFGVVRLIESKSNNRSSKATVPWQKNYRRF